MKLKETKTNEVIKLIENVSFVGCPVKMSFMIIYKPLQVTYEIYVKRIIGYDSKTLCVGDYAYKKPALDRLRRIKEDWRKWGKIPHPDLLERQGKTFKNYYQYYEAISK
jgi:hypothetical protein